MDAHVKTEGIDGAVASLVEKHFGAANIDAKSLFVGEMLGLLKNSDYESADRLSNIRLLLNEVSGKLQNAEPAKYQEVIKRVEELTQEKPAMHPKERRRAAPWIKLGHGKVAMETIEVSTADHHAIVFSPLEQAMPVGSNLAQTPDFAIANTNNVVLSFANEDSANALISLIRHCVSRMSIAQRTASGLSSSLQAETGLADAAETGADETKWPKTWGEATTRLQELASDRADPSEVLRCAQLIVQAARTSLASNNGAPSGFWLAPDKITESMSLAILEVDDLYRRGNRNLAAQIYDAMRQNAPRPTEKLRNIQVRSGASRVRPTSTVERGDATIAE